MARYTDRWGLSILGPGDSIQAEGYKFADADRRLLDRILKWAAENHRHTGADGQDTTPTVGPGVAVQLTGGAMPSGGRFYYRYTVTDHDGNESAPSPMASVDMPSAIVAPQAPIPTAITGTGALLPGTYSYVVSAYKAASSLETKAQNAAVIKIPGPASTNSVQLVLPGLPLGATGLNVYRRSPSGLHYLWITNIDAPVHGQTWIDDGSIEGDCDRALPSSNRTSNSNAVTVTFPGATPTLPDGWSWTIYRTDNPADWSRSYLRELVPEGVVPSTPVTFLDIGAATEIGAPPNRAQVINAPPKITLTDAAEVQGSLPPGLVTVPVQVTFVEPGPVTVGTGRFVWTCDFDMADILQVRAYLAPDSMPANDDVVVDVNVFTGATPSWQSIFADGPSRPTVPVGVTVGTPSVPTIRQLVRGDMLSVDVDQAGGGATPTDVNLTVNILMYAKSGSETASYTWA